MKRFGVTCFLTLLCIQFMGVNGYFMIRQMLIWETMHEQSLIDSDKVERLEFDYLLFQTLFDDEIPNEFELHGNMYDVIRIERFPGKVVVFAVHDAAEDELISFIKSIFTPKSSKPLPATMMNILTLQYLPSFFSMDFGFYSLFEHQVRFLLIHHSSFFSIITPPPKDLA
jgi:hypothetical protein